MKKIKVIITFVLITGVLSSCSLFTRNGKDPLPTADPATPSEIVSEEPTPTVNIIKPPEETGHPEPEAELVPWDGIVEHLFFHPVITYTEMAFDGDYEEAGLDEYMVTLSEYKKILQSLYDNNYILVNMNDVWSEYTDDSGVERMKRNTLMIPEGKKPLILSYDDVNYYQYMIDNGFTHRLIIGRDGDIWSYGLDPEGNVVVSQDLDAVTVLDKFVKENPDFSLDGAKGLLCLTGYQGILGYRTNTETGNNSPEFEANRQNEIARVKPIVERLKETGWYFSSHSWGHINFESSSLSRVKTDAERWMDEVGSLIGPTKLLVYPYGGRLDGGDVNQTGEAFKYYHSLGFRVFASVGIESYSKIKTDISAVICDRMHSDGGTLRRERDRYMKFYDAALVWDDARTEKYGRSW